MDAQTLQAYVVVAKFVQVLADLLLDVSQLDLLSLHGDDQLLLNPPVVVLQDLLDPLAVSSDACLDLLPVLGLGVTQMGHHRR